MDHHLTREIIQWDVRTWRRALPSWQRSIDAHKPQRALAIGERDGGLSLWLALQGIDVLCTDRRDLPAGTRALHQRHGVSDRIAYDQQDATAIALPDASFDVVVFKSVIGALRTKERQSQALREMHRVLKHGGVLLFAENMAGTLLHAWLRKRFVTWDSYWRYLRLPEDRDLFTPFARVDLHTTGLLANFGRSEEQRDLLARLDALLCPATPRSWHYVLFGACTKGG